MEKFLNFLRDELPKATQRKTDVLTAKYPCASACEPLYRILSDKVGPNHIREQSAVLEPLCAMLRDLWIAPVSAKRND